MFHSSSSGHLTLASVVLVCLYPELVPASIHMSSDQEEDTIIYGIAYSPINVFTDLSPFLAHIELILNLKTSTSCDYTAPNMLSTPLPCHTCLILGIKDFI